VRAVGARPCAGVLARTLGRQDAAVRVEVLAQQGVVAGLQIDAVEVQPDQPQGEVGAALVVQDEGARVEEVADCTQRRVQRGGGVMGR
jgi:hypothetical protein